MTETLENYNQIDIIRRICQTKEPESMIISGEHSSISIRVSHFIACLVCRYYDNLSDEGKDDFNKLGVDRMIDLAIERFQKKD